MNFLEKAKELGLSTKKMGDLPQKFKDDEEVLYIFPGLIKIGNSGAGKSFWFGITKTKLVGWGKFFFKEETKTILWDKVHAIDTNYSLGGSLIFKMNGEDFEIAGKVKILKEVEKIASDLIGN
jgi:hypothetical protein